MPSLTSNCLVRSLAQSKASKYLDQELTSVGYRVISKWFGWLKIWGPLGIVRLGGDPWLLHTQAT
jgi:hypothetical protein